MVFELRVLAYDWCFHKVSCLLEEHCSVVVSNNFVTMPDLLSYAGMDEDIGVVWTVVECTGTYQNMDGASEDVIFRMKDL